MILSDGVALNVKYDNGTDQSTMAKVILDKMYVGIRLKIIMQIHIISLRLLKLKEALIEKR